MTNATVFYGYDLGGPGDWRLTPGTRISRLMNNEFEEWLTEREEAAGRTLDDLGITEGQYHETRPSPRWTLTPKKSLYYVDAREPLDLSAVMTRRDQAWDDALTEALRLLGVTPTQPAPKWLLTLDHGY
ncbi:hypothetical protein [Actinomadura litoris]|uniref:hypothetical protein n=1 Tax=Actinomadura litoris TaxID=2678616 RepID=UPI001FA78C28|nr:hypothetical protein [Actinomadura litoris]